MDSAVSIVSLHAAPRRREGLAGTGLALLSAIASGTLGLWGKLAATLHLSAPTLLTWRFGLAAAALFALGFGRVPARERARLLLVGALYAASTVAFFLALPRISASTAALLVYVAPAFVVLYGLLAGTRPPRAQLAALACSLSGLGVVVGLPGAADADAAGLLLGGLSGALYGAYVFASDRLARHSNPLSITAYVALGSTATFGVLGLATGQLAVPAGAGQWGVVLAILLGPTLLAIPALLAAVRRLGPTRASLLATTDPLWAVLLATALLGETLHPAQVLGGALILGGALVAQAPARPARRGPVCSPG